MPRNRNTNTLGNVGSLLQDAVDTTEDLALRDSIQLIFNRMFNRIFNRA